MGHLDSSPSSLEFRISRPSQYNIYKFIGVHLIYAAYSDTLDNAIVAANSISSINNCECIVFDKVTYSISYAVHPSYNS